MSLYHKGHLRLPPIGPILAVLSLLITGACGDSGRPEVDVRLDSGALAQGNQPAQPSEVEGNPLRFVYASVLSPERSVMTYARLGHYLSHKMGRPVEIVRRRTYAELNLLLETGEADAGLVCTGAFAAGEDGFGLEAIAIPVIGGQRTYRSYVIARRDSGLTSFQSLEGSVFAFTDPLSNTGFRYVAARLHAQGITPDEYFGRILFTYGHDNSMEAVLDGIVEAGSVDSLVWDELVLRHPEWDRQLVIIERSEKFPINPVAAKPDLDPTVKAALAQVFLSMAADPEGREILEELGTDEFVKPTAETLRGYDAIARSWKELESLPTNRGEGTI